MTIGVIPARYASTRFPGKPLARLDGRPMIQWVWEGAKRARRLERLLVATDDARISEAVRRFGGEAVMTDPAARSGTDRVWEAARETSAGIILNIQGDEPLVEPQMLDELAAALERDPAVEMATLRFPMSDPRRAGDPNVVKVVCDAEGWALYFSRSPIPFDRRQDGRNDAWYKHLGFYAYRREVLERFVQWPPSPLEQAEGLEQLRALERGVRIKVLTARQETIGVDTPEDLKRVEAMLKNA